MLPSLFEVVVVVGIGRGVWLPFRAVVVAVMMATGMTRVLREFGGWGEGMSFARGF